MNKKFKFENFVTEIVDRFPNLKYYQQHDSSALNEKLKELTYFQAYNSFMIPNRYIDEFFSVDLFKSMTGDSEIEESNLLMFLKTYKVICHANNQDALIYADSSNITFGCHKITCKVFIYPERLVKKDYMDGYLSFGEAYTKKLFPHLQEKVREKLEKEIEHLGELSEYELKLLSMIQY